MSAPEYWRDTRHPDFRNVIRVARFHQTPRRRQFLVDPAPNVIVLALTRGRRAVRRRTTLAPKDTAA